MFRLHDVARRRICIAGFFLLCVAPTAVVAAWCAWRHRPGYLADESRRLGRELGLAVSLDAVKYLRPGAARYEGLELADPETGQTVFRCRVLEAGWKKAADPQGRQRSTLVLSASEPEIETAAASQLGRLLRRVLQRGRDRPETHVQFSAGDLTLRSEHYAQTLVELHGGIDAFPTGTEAWIGFRLAGVDMLQPVRIRVGRNRQTAPPVTGFELDTGGNAIPCSVLALGLPGFNQLGPRSQFRGIIWASEARQGPACDGCSADATGQLIDVDLGRLVTDCSAHQLSGLGLVTIQSARIRRGRLQQATGTLQAGPGVISRSLITAAVERLHLIEGAQPATPGDLVPYEQLALAAILDADGLSIQGRCRAAGLGTVLVDRHSRLLSEPVFQPQPVAALLQTLVPANEVQVPATRQTDWLMRHLPLPPVESPKGRQNFGVR